MPREQIFGFDPFISTPSSMVPLRVVRNVRARRYLLSIKADRTAQLTIPRGGSISEAKAFLARNLGWLERASQRVSARPRLAPEWKLGTAIYWRGELAVLRLSPDRGPNVVAFAHEHLMVRDPGADLRPEIERFVRLLATRELPLQVAELARIHSIAVGRVTVRNQRSRWGSCSSRGTISLNWRILQAPPFVGQYLIIHELMHRREMNHSRRFWDHVARACPNFQEAEAWLTGHGHLLR